MAHIWNPPGVNNAKGGNNGTCLQSTLIQGRRGYACHIYQAPRKCNSADFICSECHCFCHWAFLCERPKTLTSYVWAMSSQPQYLHSFRIDKSNPFLLVPMGTTFGRLKYLHKPHCLVLDVFTGLCLPTLVPANPGAFEHTWVPLLNTCPFQRALTLLMAQLRGFIQCPPSLVQAQACRSTATPSDRCFPGFF